MIFERFYLGCLAHASYLIGSAEPLRSSILNAMSKSILEAAQRHNLRIAHVIETHLHADFVSVHLELASRTGAAIYLGEGSRARFAHHAVRDGDEIRFGD